MAGTWLGSLLLVVALAVRLVTIPLPIPFLGDLAFLIGLTGLFTVIMGATALKRYWFAFFFLVFMVPLPIALYSKIASPLQLFASRVASTVMNATGVPVLCEGNKMTLPGGLQMFVAEACSGMRQLTGFLALTTAVAYWTTRPAWYRVVIVISALPIALSANIARVMLTGYIMHFVNPQFALGTYHTLEGLLMMGFGLLLLQAECWVLDQVWQLLLARQAQHPEAGRLRSRCRGRTARQRPCETSVCSNYTVRIRDVATQACSSLRCDPGDRPGGPGRPGEAQSNRTARCCGCRWLRFRWSWETGSDGTSRSIPISSSERRRPST